MTGGTEAHPNNLPLPLSSFIGRERELQTVRGMLEGAHLLTFAGAAGIGKTRLALRLATQVLDRYPDGIWRVELAAVTDPALVPQEVAAALGVREEPRLDFLQTLVERLRHTRTLLILDNCERLVAACAQLADGLLQSCAGVSLLVTSREPAGMAGETIWRVPSLEAPGETEDPSGEDPARWPALALFVDRASAVRSGFAITSQNANAVAQICRRLDGIPLAIELAAARVRALTPEQIAARLDDRFRLLTGGARTAPPRQQTLRAALDWSHDLLTPSEQALLRRASVFAGGWTLEAAEAVCSGESLTQDQVLDTLTSLIDRSLVLAAPNEREERYYLLETVREYGAGKLRELEEPAAVWRRHRDWYLTLAEQASGALWGAGQRETLERLQTEIDNLRAALERSADDQNLEINLQIAGALTRFWEMRGYLSEGRRWLEPVAAAGGRISAPVRARALAGAGLLARHQGDYANAAVLLEESLKLYRELGDEWFIALTLNHLGAIARRQRDYERARALLEESLALRRKLGDSTAVALSLTSLAILERDRRQPQRAEALLLEALGTFQMSGDTQGLSIALNNLGTLARQRGDLPAARRFLGESLGLCQRLKDPEGIAHGLAGLAAVAATDDRLEHAVMLLGRARRLLTTIAARLGPTDEQTYASIEDGLRRSLGEQPFSTAWTDGEEMALDAAITEALTAAKTETGRPDEPRPEQQTAAPHANPDGLSSREIEVLGLLAAGKSNREIAATLVLSPPTVERHVANIYRKIGVHGRAGAATYAVHHGLLAPTDPA